MTRAARVFAFAVVALVGCAVTGGECVDRTGENCINGYRVLDCEVDTCVAENTSGDKFAVKSARLGTGGVLHVTARLVPNTDELQLALRDDEHRPIDAAFSVAVNGTSLARLDPVPGSSRPHRFRLAPAMSGTVTIDLSRTDTTSVTGNVEVKAVATTATCRECPQ